MPAGKVTGSVCHGQCQKPGRFPEDYPLAVWFWANNSSSITGINHLRGGRETQKPPHPLPSLDGAWQLAGSKSREETEVAQSFSTLLDPMDRSPPGSSVHGILQARTLEWVAISFSRGSSQPRDLIWISSTAGRLFAVWATRESPSPEILTINKPQCFFFLMLLLIKKKFMLLFHEAEDPQTRPLPEDCIYHLGEIISPL